jgi:CO dehydrogenase nickel-insertion accessory protein CooC1
MAVANKVKNLEEIRFLRERFSDTDLEIVRTIPYDINVAKADVAGTAPVDYAPSSPAIKSIKEFSAYLEENFD